MVYPWYLRFHLDPGRMQSLNARSSFMLGRHLNPLAKKKKNSLQERRKQSCCHIVMFQRIGRLGLSAFCQYFVQRYKGIQEGPFSGPIFFLSFFFLSFLSFLPHSWHMEVLRLGVQLELQPLAYSIATAT